MSDISSPSITDDPVTSPHEGIGLSNPQLSRESRRMLDRVNKLQNTGIGSDIDLPQVAVIGSQSAGKSSLIESISGITLPRASGTCTRCPTECRLSYSNEEWHCDIFLLYTVNKDGQPCASPRNERFGGTIKDRSQVEERLRRAQRAILNPSTPAKQFLEKEEEDLESELSFSQNRVVLQIKGPDVADLSFIDLPGLIVNAGRDGNDSDIKLIESLIISFISKPSCLILLTVTCETDFQNQGAQRLARKYDSNGQRTIGVLTKPDRIDAGDEGYWIKLVKNEEEALENNWYCVKQPSPTDLKKGVTWKQARENENVFFSTTPCWKNLDLTYQKYLRTSNLLIRVSSVLSSLIAKRLPEIKTELEKTIQEVQETIAKLPPAPSSSPQLDVSSLVSAFGQDLAMHVEGIPNKDGILQRSRPLLERFKRRIQRSAPDFRPYDKADDDDDDSEFKLPDSILGEYQDSLEAQPPSKAIYIGDVMRRAEDARTRQLPGNHPYSVVEDFISEVTQKWLQPAKNLCQCIDDIVWDYVKVLIRKHFQHFGQGMLEQMVRHLVRKHMTERLQETQHKIKWLFELEKRPSTLNTHYLRDCKEKLYAHYKGSRQKDTNSSLINGINRSPTGGHLGTALSNLAALGFQGIKGPDLARLLPGDAMDSAIMIMAEVRAYFQVAYKRFTDIISLAVDHDLVQGLGPDILSMLNTALGIYGPKGHERCAEMAQESPQLAGRREELGERLTRLSQASEEFDVMAVFRD